MSNARNTAQLINKFSPTASGVDLTGNLSVSGTSAFTGEITANSNLNYVSPAAPTGGPDWRFVVNVSEATNSSPVSSSSSSLTMDDHTFTLSADGIVSGNANIEVMAWGNGRYVEDSDDPSIRPRIEMYNYATSNWAGITDGDNYFQNRHSDRGSSNYHRSGYALWTTFMSIGTNNYLSSNNEVRVRLGLIGGGGTGNDDLDNYFIQWRLTQWSRD